MEAHGQQPGSERVEIDEALAESYTTPTGVDVTDTVATTALVASEMTETVLVV